MSENDLKRKVTALEQEINFLKQIIMHIPTHVYWKNKKGVYLGCNKAQATTLGLPSVDDFVGKRVTELVSEVYAPAIEKIDNKIMRTKKEMALEEYSPDIDGNPAIYLTKKTPLYDKNGNVTGLLGVSTDITELKKTEFLSSIYFQNILDVLPENFYWTDKNGTILGCNNNHAKLYGLQSSSQLIGKTIFKAAENAGWDKETIETLRKNHRNVMRTREAIKVEETVMIDGALRTFLSYKNPLINPKKQVMGVFGVTVDITEQKALENALRVAKEKAEEISRMKSEFIHNMEHDIRTPFAGIYGLSSALAAQESESEKKEALIMIANSSKELLEYASHILAFAQVEEEFNHVLSKKLSLHEIIKSVVTMELPPAKNKKLELTYTIDEDIPRALMGDPERFKGILINLLSNALKFTEKGRVSINATLIRKNKHEAIISCSVADTGIGIPKDKQKSIYEKFFRISPTNQGIYKGFGLGLKIVKKFVEELNGEIDLESTPGEGTTFTFTLPFGIPF